MSHLMPIAMFVSELMCGGTKYDLKTEESGIAGLTEIVQDHAIPLLRSWAECQGVDVASDLFQAIAGLTVKAMATQWLHERVPGEISPAEAHVFQMRKNGYDAFGVEGDE